jgi:hypothetical protein
MNRQQLKPGNGWRHLAGPVWEHTNGSRVHVMGLVKLPDGSFLSANVYPQCNEAARLIRINGGNRKRGLMAWARIHNRSFNEQ